MFTSTAWAGKQAHIETGDQAKVEIADGFFMDSEIGLLTYLVTDGAKVYKPGILVSLRLGGNIGDFSIYGKIAATVTGNTTCYSNASRCAQVKTKFPTAANSKLRNIGRQGVSLLAGAGARWYFFKMMDERFRLHLDLEAMFHFIPADNIPKDRLDRLTANAADKKTFAAHLNPAIGAAAGLGIGFEYFFILKHFSIGANALGYFFFTEFMPKSMLGLALLVSADIKYTF